MTPFTIDVCSICLVPEITGRNDRATFHVIQMDFGRTVKFCPECAAEHKLADLIRIANHADWKDKRLSLSVTVLLDGEPVTAGEGPASLSSVLFNERPRIRLK